MSWLVRVNKPWLHFIVLGVIFYQLQSALFPEPKLVIGPLSEARIAMLGKQWLTSTGRQPSTEQIAKYVAVELDRDMLLQRAIDLEFHLHDSIVFQRLVRNMKFIQLAKNKSDAELFHQAIEMRMHLQRNRAPKKSKQLSFEERMSCNILHCTRLSMYFSHPKANMTQHPLLPQSPNKISVSRRREN